jgi:hypothetical protein
MSEEEKRQIKYLLDNLKWYAEAPNVPDYNGEYAPPMEWEQGEVKILLKYMKEKDVLLDKYKQVIDKIKEIINHYAVENEDYSKIYNQEETEIMKILEDLDE